MIMLTIRSFFLRNVRNMSTKTYTETQEWFVTVKNKPNHIRLGLTNEAIEQLTDLVYIDTDSIDKNKIYEKEETICEIESVKAVENIYAPSDCYVTDFNTENLDNINKEPENLNNWIIEMNIKP